MLPYRYLIKPWVMLSVLFFSMIIYLYVDKNVCIFFQKFLNHDIHFFDYFLNHIARGIFLLPLTFLVLLYVRFMQNNTTWFYRMSYLLYVLFLDHLTLTMLKVCFGRARPYLYPDLHVFGFQPFTLSHDFYSFPSGHTIVWMAITGFIALLIKSPWRYLSLAVGILLSFSRVWQNVHYFSDWFFSIYLSLLMFPIATILLQYFLPKKHMQALCLAMGFASKET